MPQGDMLKVLIPVVSGPQLPAIGFVADFTGFA